MESFLEILKQFRIVGDFWNFLEIKDENVYRDEFAKYPGHKAIATDACVPISELANLIDQTAKDINESGIPGPIWGHVGDGNFHATLLIKEGDLKEKKLAQAIIHRMCERSLELGGTVTGEHGIGMGKLNFMEKEQSTLVL